MKDILIRSTDGLAINTPGSLVKDIRNGVLTLLTDTGNEVTVNWDNVFYVSEVDVE